MYNIMSKYKNQSWECIDRCETKEEAEKLLSEYRMAFDDNFQLEITKSNKNGIQLSNME